MVWNGRTITIRTIKVKLTFNQNEYLITEFKNVRKQI